MSRLLHTSLSCALAVLAIAGCGDTTDTAPNQLNLDRPVDVSFACYGGLRLTGGGSATVDQTITNSAQPYESCNVRSGPRDVTAPQPVPLGQEDLTSATPKGLPVPAVNWIGFVLQKGPGTVAVSEFATKPSTQFTGGDVTVLDTDVLTPGENSISVGEEPVALVTDKIGCYEVIANAGSCDLSILDINSVFPDPTTRIPDVHVDRLDVKNASGVPIRSRPAAMVVEPPAGTIGAACPAAATGIVYIAYPSCHLVAAVDASTGTVVDGITFDANNVATHLGNGNVTCPDECGGTDAITAGARPLALDLKEDARSHARRLAIGAEKSNIATIVELDPTTSLPLSMMPVTFENTTGDLGITAITISPQIGMGGAGHVINDDTAQGGQFQYLYAVATDRTVRVADILNLRPTTYAECDTQIDPRFIRAIRSVRAVSCFAVGDPTNPPRRPGARGPGIELTDSVEAESVPNSIAIFKADAIDGDARSEGPSRLIGYFGVISTTSGKTYILNVDDDDYGDLFNPAAPFDVIVPLAIANQLRDGLPNRDAISETSTTPSMPVCNTDGPNPDDPGGNVGGPRTAQFPSRGIPPGFIDPNRGNELPSIRQVLCTGLDTTRPVSEMSFAAPTAVRDHEFPDLRALRGDSVRGDEYWTMTWEGSLADDSTSTTSGGSPGIRNAQMFVDSNGIRLVDHTGPFCDAGVEPYDIVQLRGCDPQFGDTDCPLGYVCYVHPDSQVTGLGACMLTNEATSLATACKDFLTSERRYTIARAATGELVLAPRKHELRTTPLDGCTSTPQCHDLATYLNKTLSPSEPGVDTTPPDTHTWSCEVDGDRPTNLDGTPKQRCLETCTDSSQCDLGTVCEHGYCMEGVTPPQACINAPQRFELRAHDAFTMLGSLSGYTHRIIADASGSCVTDPTASPWQIGRIPLEAPACDPTADPITGQLPSGALEANPCSLTTTQSELAPNYTPGTCALDNPQTVLSSRQAPAIEFRNRGFDMTLVDPYYPGDQTCFLDRQGTLSKVPLVFNGYQLTWRQTAGFTPLLLAITASLPVKVVHGPTESIWVVDEGDFISTDVTLPSTRGKVWRVEAQGLTTINILQ